MLLANMLAATGCTTASLLLVLLLLLLPLLLLQGLLPLFVPMLLLLGWLCDVAVHPFQGCSMLACSKQDKQLLAAGTIAATSAAYTCTLR
jgi:hypothetical protein